MACSAGQNAKPSGKSAGELNTDRPGATFKELSAKTSFDCSKACEKEKNCRSWTFVKADAQRGASCELKNAVPASISDPCCSSGLRGLQKDKVYTKKELRVRRQEAMSKKKAEMTKLEKSFNEKNKEIANSVKELEKKELLVSQPKVLDTKEVESLSTEKATKAKELEAITKSIEEEKKAFEAKISEISKKKLALAKEVEQLSKDLKAKEKSIKDLKTKQAKSKEKEFAQLKKERAQLSKSKEDNQTTFTKSSEEVEKEYQTVIDEIAAILEKQKATETAKATPEKPVVIKGASEVDVNRVGGDYSIVDLKSASPRSCKQVCEDEKRCLAWTYVKPNVLGPSAQMLPKR